MSEPGAKQALPSSEDRLAKLGAEKKLLERSEPSLKQQ